MRAFAVFCLCFFGGACSTPPPGGLIVQQVIGDQGPASLALPTLLQSAPPPWVQTGLRLTYHIETATIAGTGQEWKPDENGAWETPDHQRWTPGERRSGAAEGFMQFDVTAAGSSTTAILGSFYLVPRMGAVPQLSFQYPVVGLPGNAGGLWVNPTDLKQMKERNTPSFKVLRMPYRIGGTTRPSVWIHSSTSKGYQVYVYDEATGVLLHDASSVAGDPSKVIGQGEVSNTPSTILADGTLVGQRVLALPWLGENAADWATRAAPMAYSGTTLVPTSGGSPLVLRQELSVKPSARGQGWVVFDALLKTSNSVGMPPTTTPSQTVSGLGQFGSAWLPPAALAKLERGQKLDSDPVTGVAVTVTDVKSGQVILTASSAAQTTRWGYDLRSGLLNFIEKEDHNVFAPITTRMTLVR